MSYTDIFNFVADRREQSLPYIGEERRAFMQELKRQKEEAGKTRAFLEGLGNIEDISRIAKNVNGNV